MNKSDSKHVNDAWSAIVSAKSIVDCLADCTQVDRDSCVLGALGVVLDYLGKAEQSVNAIGGAA